MNKELFSEMIENMVDMIAESEESSVKMKAIMKVEKVNRLNMKIMKLDSVDGLLEKYGDQFTIVTNCANEIIEQLTKILNDFKN